MSPLTFALLLILVIGAAGLTIWASVLLGLPTTVALILGLGAALALHVRRSKQ